MSQIKISSTSDLALVCLSLNELYSTVYCPKHFFVNLYDNLISTEHYSSDLFSIKGCVRVCVRMRVCSEIRVVW